MQGSAPKAQHRSRLGSASYPFVGEYGADAGHDGEYGAKQALEDDGVVDVGGGGRARDGDAVRPDCDVVPNLNSFGGFGR